MMMIMGEELEKRMIAKEFGGRRNNKKICGRVTENVLESEEQMYKTASHQQTNLGNR